MLSRIFVAAMIISSTLPGCEKESGLVWPPSTGPSLTVIPGLLVAANNGLTSLEISGIAVNNKGYLYVTTKADAGLFVSTDNGDSWTHRSTPAPVKALLFNSRDEILANCDSAFASSDGGMTWTPKRFSPAGGYLLFPYGFDKEDHLWALVIYGLNYGLMVVESSDGGTNWSQRLDFGPSQPSGGWSGVFSSRGYYFVSCEGHGGAGAAVMRSTDFGLTWASVLGCTIPPPIWETEGGEVFVGIVPDFRYSNDFGQHWVTALSGLSVSYVDGMSSLALSADSILLAKVYTFSGTSLPSMLYYSKDKGKNWVGFDVGSLKDELSAVVGTPSGEIFVTTLQSGVFRIDRQKLKSVQTQ